MKKIISLIITTLMLISILPGLAVAEYKDIQGHWGQGSIENWVAKKVVDIYDGDEFGPDTAITRGEVAMYITNLLGLNKTGDLSDFDDIDEKSEYNEAMAKCYAAGIFAGRGEGKMAADSNITREEFMCVFSRIMSISGQKSTNESKENMTELGFKDVDKVSNWAASNVELLISENYVSGVGNNMIAPKASINRASVVALLDKSITTYVGVDDDVTTVEAKAEGITLIANPNVTKVTGNANIVVISAGAEKYDEKTNTTSENTITFENAAVSVARIQGENINVNLAGTTSVKDAEITYTGENSAIVVEEKAKVEKLAVSAEKAKVDISGTVETVEVTKLAEETVINTSSTAKISNVENKGEKTTVAGTGSVAKVSSSEDIKVETKNTAVENTNTEKEITVTDKNGSTSKVENTDTSSNVVVNKNSDSSSGSSENVLEIYSKQAFLNYVNNFNSGKADYTAKVKLTSDIDLTGTDWTPIGTWEYPYHGTFDGAGYTIKGLSATAFNADGTYKSNGQYFGLFGIVGDGNVSISNINFTNVNINNENAKNVGAVIGYIPNTADFTDSEKGGKYAPGKWATNTNVGNSQISVSGITVSGTIKVNGNAGAVIGYITEDGSVTISNCTNNSDITMVGKGAIAGIAGLNINSNVTVKNCVNGTDSKLSFVPKSNDSTLLIADYIFDKSEEGITKDGNTSDVTVNIADGLTFSAFENQITKPITINNLTINSSNEDLGYIKNFGNLTLNNSTCGKNFYNQNGSYAKLSSVNFKEGLNNGNLEIENSTFSARLTCESKDSVATITDTTFARISNNGLLYAENISCSSTDKSYNNPKGIAKIKYSTFTNFQNKNVLEVEDCSFSGKLDCSESNCIATLTDGTFDTINNEGILTLEKGTFNGKITNHGQLIIGTTYPNGDLLIKDIISTGNKTDDTNLITINGGTFTKNVDKTIDIYGSLCINGGDFTTITQTGAITIRTDCNIDVYGGSYSAGTVFCIKKNAKAYGTVVSTSKESNLTYTEIFAKKPAN